MAKIKVKRGIESSLPIGDIGEPLWTTDSHKLFIGDGSINYQIGSVFSVALTTPTGLSISGSPITTSGTLALSLTSGYVIPTTTEETNWNTAYTNRITSASLPLSIASNVLSIAAATTSVNGYLSSTDWNTFNGKQASLGGSGIVKSTAGTISYLTDNSSNWDSAYTNRITSLTTTGSNGAATLSSNTLNIPTYTATGLGAVPTSRTITINSTSYDLSADRSWTINAGIPIATAGATVNAQTGTYSPTITLATNTVVILNSVGLNTSPSPTATIDSNAAKTIVRAGNQPLMAGDTGLAGYPMMLVYNGTNLVLVNPFIDCADRTQMIKDENEFIGTSTAEGWSVYVSGTGASGTSLMSTFGKGNGWGWMGGQCGTTTTGRVMFLKLPNSNEYFQLGNGLTVIEYNSWTTKQSNNLPNGTDTYTSIIGWGDTTNSTNQNNGCYFSLGWSGSAVVWSTVTSAAGTRTTTTSAASIPTSVNDFFDFRIVVSTDRSNVYFYLRKNAGAWELANTHTTNIPANATSGQLVPGFGCFKSAGTNSEFNFIDSYKAYIVLTTPR